MWFKKMIISHKIFIVYAEMFILKSKNRKDTVLNRGGTEAKQNPNTLSLMRLIIYPSSTTASLDFLELICTG